MIVNAMLRHAALTLEGYLGIYSKVICYGVLEINLNISDS